MKHAGSWGQEWSHQVPSPPTGQTGHSSPKLVRGCGAEERPQGPAGRSSGLQRQGEAALGARSSAGPAAAVPEPGWAQGGCSSDRSAPWTQQPHSSRAPRCCFHQVCGEPRCGRTHSTFCAGTRRGDGTKTNQQGKPQSSITQEFTETGLLCQMWDLGGFHWLCFETFLLLRDLQLGFESPHGPDKRLGGSELGLGQTRMDWQHFHSGWHLSGSPLHSTSAFYLQCQGKNNVKKKPQIFQSSHTLKYA